MAEICRVGILLVTLLPHLLWLPPDTQGGTVTTDSGEAVNYRNITPEAAEGQGVPLPQKTGSGGKNPPKGGTTSDLYNYDELRIVDILTVYFSSGCTAAAIEAPVSKSGDDPCRMSPLPCSGHGECNRSPGNPNGDHCFCYSGWSGTKCNEASPESEYITASFRRRRDTYQYNDKDMERIADLLSSYFAADCKVNSSADENTADGQRTPGPKQIINILKAYFASGCDAGKTATKGALAMEGVNFTRGQILIVNLLSSFFASGCKGSDVFKSVSGDETPAGSGASVQHVQCCALEWSMLIVGVCLTQIDL